MVLGTGISPLGASANTGTFPAEFWFYLVSMVVIIPGIALLALARVVILWRERKLGGVWVIAVSVAILFGAMWLAEIVFTGLSISNWIRIYMPVIPVIAVWVVAARSKKRDT